MIAEVCLLGLLLVLLWRDVSVGARTLVAIRGELRRLAPGCTCPLAGEPSSTCPAHKEYVPEGKPGWLKARPATSADVEDMPACTCLPPEVMSEMLKPGTLVARCNTCNGARPAIVEPYRSPAPPPDSTDAFYVPPGRNE